MFRISKTIRNSRTPDGSVILDIHQNCILTTNLVGAAILEFMQRQFTETRIAEEISRMYGIPLETAAADLLEFAESLVRCGVLVNGDSKPDA